MGPGKQGHVRFGEVHFRLFDPAIGDNPNVSSGPPIGISWTYFQFNEMAVQMASRRRTSDCSGRNSGSCCERKIVKSKRFESGEVECRRFSTESMVLSGDHDDTSDSREAKNDKSKSSIRSELIISVDDYEMNRPPRAFPIQRLSREKRECRLRDMGYTQEEIAQAVREALRVKNRRRQTYHNVNSFALIEEMVEKGAKAVRRFCVVPSERRQMMRSSYLYNEWKAKQAQQQTNADGSDWNVPRTSSSSSSSQASIMKVLICDKENSGWLRDQS